MRRGLFDLWDELVDEEFHELVELYSARSSVRHRVTNLGKNLLPHWIGRLVKSVVEVNHDLKKSLVCVGGFLCLQLPQSQGEGVSVSVGDGKRNLALPASGCFV